MKTLIGLILVMAEFAIAGIETYNPVDTGTLATKAELTTALAGNTNTWPSAVSTSGTWTISYANGLMQRVDINGAVTNVTFATLTNTQTAVSEFYITGATNTITFPTNGFTWISEPTWTNNSVHVIFSWSLGAVSGAKDKEL